MNVKNIILSSKSRRNILEYSLIYTVAIMFSILCIIFFMYHLYIRKNKKIKSDDTINYKLLSLIFLILTISLFVLVSLDKLLIKEENKIKPNNQIIEKEISKEKYMYLAYKKDFFLKDDTKDAQAFFLKIWDPDTKEAYKKLNSLRDNIDIKNEINLIIEQINRALIDGKIYDNEFININENINNLVKFANSIDGINKVKSNLGVNINKK